MLELLFHLNSSKDIILKRCRVTVVLLCYLMMVGITSAVKRMHRDAVA